MEILKVAKVFFYIFILMVAVVLLKGLATFEYSLRDKTVSYEEVLVEEFDTNNNGFFSAFKKDTKQAKASILRINLGESDSTMSYVDIYKGEIESLDSGYIEIKYRAELSPYTIADFVWFDKQKNKQSIRNLDPNFTEFTSIKSDLIQLSEFSHLEVHLDKKAIKERQSLDSLTLNQASHLGNIYIDYLKFVSEIRQKPLF